MWVGLSCSFPSSSGEGIGRTAMPPGYPGFGDRGLEGVHHVDLKMHHRKITEHHRHLLNAPIRRPRRHAGYALSILLRGHRAERGESEGGRSRTLVWMPRKCVQASSSGCHAWARARVRRSPLPRRAKSYLPRPRPASKKLASPPPCSGIPQDDPIEHQGSGEGFAP